MKKASLIFVIRDGRILLGRKQGSPEIGEGTLNGPGGKMEPPDACLWDCAVREAHEELGIDLVREQTRKVAIVTFYAGGEPSFEVHVYLTDAVAGVPRETKSMVPEWHRLEKIPYERMLESDRIWIPRIVAGERFNARVFYREKAKGYEGIEYLPFEDRE